MRSVSSGQITAFCLYPESNGKSLERSGETGGAFVLFCLSPFDYSGENKQKPKTRCGETS